MSTFSDATTAYLTLAAQKTSKKDSKDKYKAFEFEKYLKSGSGRAFMVKRFVTNVYL